MSIQKEIAYIHIYILSSSFEISCIHSNVDSLNNPLAIIRLKNTNQNHNINCKNVSILRRPTFFIFSYDVECYYDS